MIVGWKAHPRRNDGVADGGATVECTPVVLLDRFPAGVFLTGRFAAVRGHRLGRARVRVSARTLAAFGLLVVGACNPLSGPTLQTSPPSASSGVSIPTGELPAWVQCAVDQGFRVARVDPPEIEGDPPRYVLEADYPAAQGMEILTACRDKHAPYQEKSTAELRVIYDRWVAERECLIELGYQPDEPPSFEKFVSDWRIGPWMPIDGVDTNLWTDADYAEAKQRCVLEFFDRG